MKIELKLNHGRMGTKPKSESWEWYTAEIPKVCFIHIHNQTGQWKYKIYSAVELESHFTYDTKKAAFTAALKSLQTIAIAFLESVEETLGREL